MADIAFFTSSFTDRRALPRCLGILPGLTLCCAVAATAGAIEAGERALFGRAGLEALVLSIVIGTAVRSLWRPSLHWQAGIVFASKTLLEVAVMLLGLSVSAGMVLAVGPAMIAGIAAVVVCAIVVSFGLGKLFGLRTRMALLIACGNAICGNSAIAAVAPVIEAEADDVAAAIAFTAVLGIAVVLGLPVLGVALGWSGVAYGTFAGLTVYAVPQVLAAATPFGVTAVQMGTLVKLVRVMMLGPVCVALSLAMTATQASRTPTDDRTARRPRLSLTGLVPWFILGFLALSTCRSLGLVPDAVLAPAATAATALTVVSMAALGLGVDVRDLGAAGPRVTVVVVLSLGGLGVLGAALIHGLGLA